jgi:hypothetical protein
MFPTGTAEKVAEKKFAGRKKSRIFLVLSSAE